MGLLLILILFGVPMVGMVLMIIGLVRLFNQDQQVRKAGRRSLLTGFIVIVLGILIGFSICTLGPF